MATRADWQALDRLKAQLRRATDPKVYLLTSRELQHVERRIYGKGAA